MSNHDRWSLHERSFTVTAKAKSVVAIFQKKWDAEWLGFICFHPNFAGYPSVYSRVFLLVTLMHQSPVFVDELIVPENCWSYSPRFYFAASVGFVCSSFVCSQVLEGFHDEKFSAEKISASVSRIHAD
jgi:hypothetical protein